MAISPTARSLRKLREDGYTAQVVEKFVPWSKTRLDLFGGIDICAIKLGVPGVLGVQATSDNGGNVASHVRKLESVLPLKTWIGCGNRLQVWGWGKKGARGKRKTWQVRIVDVI